MNTRIKLISNDVTRYNGVLAGHAYDLYKQVREDARHKITMVRYIRRYKPYIDDSLEGFKPRMVRPVEKSAILKWHYICISYSGKEKHRNFKYKCKFFKEVIE